MAETAADLIDNILPQVPVRQWVLLPFVPELNYFLGTHAHSLKFKSKRRVGKLYLPTHQRCPASSTQLHFT
jgi:hypothetical protein